LGKGERFSPSGASHLVNGDSLFPNGERFLAYGDRPTRFPVRQNTESDLFLDKVGSFGSQQAELGKNRQSNP
jgi:hypothetical protein